MGYLKRVETVFGMFESASNAVARDVIYSRIEIECAFEELKVIFENEENNVIISLYSEDNDYKKDLFFTIMDLDEAIIGYDSLTLPDDDGMPVVIRLIAP